jgi:hypothetical protein
VAVAVGVVGVPVLPRGLSRRRFQRWPSEEGGSNHCVTSACPLRPPRALRPPPPLSSRCGVVARTATDRARHQLLRGRLQEWDYACENSGILEVSNIVAHQDRVSQQLRGTATTKSEMRDDINRKVRALANSLLGQLSYAIALQKTVRRQCDYAAGGAHAPTPARAFLSFCFFSAAACSQSRVSRGARR